MQISADEDLDPEQRIALAYAPASAKPAWLALFLFEKKLAEAAKPGREPLMIQLRLAWWRDRLGEPATRWPISEPVLANLRAWQDRHGDLVGLVDGWEACAVGEDGGVALAQARVAALVALSEVLGVRDVETVRQVAQDLVGLAASSKFDRAVPKPMRPLAVLRVLARRGVEGRKLKAIGDLLRLVRAGVVGK